jgi:uncharacterized membrane protein YkoI
MKNLFVAGALALSLAMAGAVAMAAKEKGEENEKKVEYRSSIQVSPKLEDEKALAKRATISREEAIRIAQTAAKGKVIEAAVENEDGNLIYNVEVNNGEETKEVIVDAGNGKVLAVNADEDGEGPEGDEKAEGPEGPEGPETN